MGLHDVQRDLATLVDQQDGDINRIGLLSIIHEVWMIIFLMISSDKHVSQAEVRVSEGLNQTEQVNHTSVSLWGGGNYNNMHTYT